MALKSLDGQAVKLKWRSIIQLDSGARGARRGLCTPPRCPSQSGARKLRIQANTLWQAATEPRFALYSNLQYMCCNAGGSPPSFRHHLLLLLLQCKCSPKSVQYPPPIFESKNFVAIDQLVGLVLGKGRRLPVASRRSVGRSVGGRGRREGLALALVPALSVPALSVPALSSCDVITPISRRDSSNS